MEIKKYNRFNFYQHTFCVFQELDPIAIQNLKVDFKSKSGSSYSFTKDGVYRLSNHWGRAANCKWRLEQLLQTGSRTKLGFALWTSFHPDDAVEKCYFIIVDFDQQSASYQHRDSGIFDEKSMLRNAVDTSRRLKQIRNLYATAAWAKHFDLDDIFILRRKIIEKLMATDQSLHQIKSELQNTL